MFWFWLFVVAVIVLIVSFALYRKYTKAYYAHEQFKTYYNSHSSQTRSKDYDGIRKLDQRSTVFSGITIGACVVSVLLFLLVGVWHMAEYTSANSAAGKFTQVERKIHQRDDLVDLVKNELSAEQYNALFQFTDVDQMKIFFRDTGASNLLISRAATIVALNQALLAEYNDAIQTQINVCTWKRNFFSPRVPGVKPECHIDLIDALDPVTVYGG